MDVLRLGTISTINYTDGTARVQYKDRDKAVTVELPLFSFEYRMPQVDDLVLVCHLPNGAAAGVILGPVWNDNERPQEGFEGLYRKDLDKSKGKAMIRYDANTGQLRVVMPDTRLQCPTVLVQGDVTIDGDLTVTGTLTCSKTVTAAVDVVGGGVSLKGHTHTCPDGTTSSPN